MSLVSRLSTLVRGFAESFVGGLEKVSPEALLDLERENLRAQVAKYNSSLAAHAATTERLRSQLKKLEDQERKARAKLTKTLQSGDRTAAGTLAVQHQTMTAEIAALRAQLQAAEETYTNLTKARDVLVAQAKQKLSDVSQRVGELETHRAGAAIDELAAPGVGAIGEASESLSRLEELVADEHDRSAGRARLARDQLANQNPVAVTEPIDPATAAEAALAEFAAREGIQIGVDGATRPAAPTTPAAAEPQPASAKQGGEAPKPPGSGKSMGPRQGS